MEKYENPLSGSKQRILIESFPGLPEGAGIYRLPDGTERFFNCAPGQSPQACSGPETYYRIIDPTSGAIEFVIHDPEYRWLKNGLKLAGVDIQSIKTETQLDGLLSTQVLGTFLGDLRRTQILNRPARSLNDRYMRALAAGDIDELNRLSARKKIRQQLQSVRCHSANLTANNASDSP